MLFLFHEKVFILIYSNFNCFLWEIWRKWFIYVSSKSRCYSWYPTTSGISDLTGIEDFRSLKLLTISGSLLSNLDLKNGLNHILTSLGISDCPNLSCVEVDDSNWSTNNWTNVDSQIYFSEDCQ